MDLFAKVMGKEIDGLDGEGVRIELLGHVEALPLTTRTHLQAGGKAHGRQRWHDACHRRQLRLASRDNRRRQARLPPTSLPAPWRPTTSTRRLSAAGSTRRICPTPTCASGRAASCACPTSCCGSSPTRSSSSPMCCGPDFDRYELARALMLDFQNRNRRFGKVDEQSKCRWRLTGRTSGNASPWVPSTWPSSRSSTIVSWYTTVIVVAIMASLCCYELLRMAQHERLSVPTSSSGRSRRASSRSPFCLASGSTEHVVVGGLDRRVYARQSSCSCASSSHEEDTIVDVALTLFGYLFYTGMHALVVHPAARRTIQVLEGGIMRLHRAAHRCG